MESVEMLQQQLQELHTMLPDLDVENVHAMTQM